MKHALGFLVFAASLSQTALAGNELLGSWRFQGVECSSGAKVENKPDALDWNQYLLYTFTATEVKMDSRVSFKLGDEKADQLIKANQGMKEFWNKMPDSPSRTASLKTIEENIVKIEAFKQGRECLGETAQPYALHGSELRVGRATFQTSTCPDLSTEKVQQTSQPVSTTVEGGTLKMWFDVETPLKDSRSCPKGDKTIWVFTRAASGLG